MLQGTGSVAVAQGLSCSGAHGIFPDQESNPHLLHWQTILTHWTAKQIPLHSFYLDFSPLYLQEGKLRFTEVELTSHDHPWSKQSPLCLPPSGAPRSPLPLFLPPCASLPAQALAPFPSHHQQTLYHIHGIAFNLYFCKTHIFVRMHFSFVRRFLDICVCVLCALFVQMHSHMPAYVCVCQCAFLSLSFCSEHCVCHPSLLPCIHVALLLITA